MKHENARSGDIAPAPIDPGDSVALPAGGADPAGVVGLALSAGDRDPGVVSELRGFLRK